jgi:hypothetical protein
VIGSLYTETGFHRSNWDTRFGVTFSAKIRSLTAYQKVKRLTLPRCIWMRAGVLAKSMALETITAEERTPWNSSTLWVTSELVSISTVCSRLFTAFQNQHARKLFTSNDRIQSFGDSWASSFCGIFVMIVSVGLSQNEGRPRHSRSSSVRILLTPLFHRRCREANRKDWVAERHGPRNAHRISASPALGSVHAASQGRQTPSQTKPNVDNNFSPIRIQKRSSNRVHLRALVGLDFHGVLGCFN